MLKNQRRLLILAFVTGFALIGCAQKPDLQEDTSSSDVVGSDTADTTDTTRSGLSDQDIGSGVASDMDSTTGADSAMPSENVVYFDFDSSNIGQETRDILSAHAAYLAANPGIKIRVEGHADERGTREYNMALGERRANAVTEVL
ncbi:MAG TPA: peptidoglycan-associated lipoprotein, partial [Gammaproteobacteria bacterium]|nr:peptidoglycan-associated lipoprotein [Gammaproteobacteria bacterium]